MASHIFLALSSPVAGREDEFHRWYDAHHLQDVVDLCPGFLTGQRYFGEDDVHPASWPSLALYQLASDDLARLHEAVSTNAGRFTPSNGVFAPDHAAWVYSAATADSANLEAWLNSAEADGLTLAFYDDASAAGPESALASPLLERGDGQRAGEHPTWRYLRLVRGAPGDLGSPLAQWMYRPRGIRAHHCARD